MENGSTSFHFTKSATASPCKFWNCTSIRPRRRSYNSYLVHHSPVILQATAEEWTCLERCKGLLALEEITELLLVEATDRSTRLHGKNCQVSSKVQFASALCKCIQVGYF